MKKTAFGTLILMMIFGFSCSNEIDLTGDYQDTPIVYGILGPNDAVHYIRIQKAFLVDGNVLQTTKIADSLTYDPSDLQVSVWECNKNGETYGSPIPFFYEPNAVTDTGLFAPDGVMMFISTAELNGYYYKLVITNTKIGKQITAITPLVNRVEWIKPSVGSIHLEGAEPYEMEWEVDTSSVTIYQPQIKFYWTEVDLTTGNSHLDSIIWDYVPLYPEYIEIKKKKMKHKLDQNSFYRYLQKQISPQANVKRIIGPLTFTLYTAPSIFEKYFQANKPALGIIQGKPAFTNIDGGFGLFSSRNKSVKSNMPLTLESKDSLEKGRFTKHLAFSKN
jgi:hypothetical protein